MCVKLFVVSDIHGHYTELMRALDRAGFDAKNEAHVFVSCGDLFDRGTENVAVYDFVRNLPRKILIKGNHEDILCEVLERGTLTNIETWNGMDRTVREMLGEDAVDENGCFDRTACAEKIDELIAFISSMVNYYEMGNYVFTHGWLPIVFDGLDYHHPRIDPSWRNASDEDWVVAHDLGWQQPYQGGVMLEGKTIVCGHRPSRFGSQFDSSREPDCSEPFYGEGVIAIDAGTVNSGRVNVIVMEESTH